LFQPTLVGPEAYYDVQHPLAFIETDLRPFDYLNKAFMDSAPAVSGRAKDLAKKVFFNLKKRHLRTEIRSVWMSR
jgi:hypothetical protein